MSTGFGHQAWIGFGQESAYGTYVAPARFLEILEEGVKLEQSLIAKPTLRQVTQYNNVPSKRNVGGSFRFQMPLTGAEVLLKHALGSISTVANGGGYDHTFTPTATLPTGLSLHINRDAAAVGSGSAFRYEGCGINKLTLSQEAEEFMIAEVEVVGEDESLGTVAVPTFPTFQGFHWANLTSFTVDSTSTPVKRFEVSIENALSDDRYVLGSRTRVGLGRSGPRKVTGSFEAEFDNKDTALSFFRNLTQVPIVISYTISSGLTLVITLPKVSLDGDEPTVADAGPIVGTWNFQAWSPNQVSAEISMVLGNSVATPDP